MHAFYSQCIKSSHFPPDIKTKTSPARKYSVTLISTQYNNISAVTSCQHSCRFCNLFYSNRRNSGIYIQFSLQVLNIVLPCLGWVYFKIFPWFKLWIINEFLQILLVTTVSLCKILGLLIVELFFCRSSNTKQLLQEMSSSYRLNDCKVLYFLRCYKQILYFLE